MNTTAPRVYGVTYTNVFGTRRRTVEVLAHSDMGAVDVFHRKYTGIVVATEDRGPAPAPATPAPEYMPARGNYGAADY